MAKAKINKRFASHAVRLVSQVFSVFSMDLIDMGNLSMGYKYILVLMDYFSGFTILYALRNKKARTILARLWEVLTLFGPPTQLLSDRGGEFINDLVQKFTEDAGITHVVTYAYHAQANGRNERIHAVIHSALTIFSQDNPARWWKFVKGIQYMLNTRPNLETGITPYEILFGKKPRNLLNVEPFLHYDHRKMKKLRSTIRAMLQESNERRLMEMNTIPPPPLEVGQLVKLVRPYPQQGHLRYKARGPYVVIKPIASSGYLIEHTITKRRIEAPRHVLFPFTRREGGGVHGNNEEQDVHRESHSTNKTMNTQKMNKPRSQIQNKEKNCEANDDDEVNRYSEERDKEDDIFEDEERNANKNIPSELKNYNKVPEQTVILDEVKKGTMVIVQNKLAEVLEIDEEDIEVQWFGTKTNRDRPRHFWKFYPVWINNDGVREVLKAQTSGKEAATSKVSRTSVHITFERLNLNGTIPEEVLDKITNYDLDA